MNRVVSAGILLASLCSASSAAAQVAPEAARTTAHFTRLLQRWGDAMIHGNPRALDSLLLNDFVFVSPRGRRIPRPVYVANRDTSGVFRAHSFHVDQVVVHVAGPVAVSISRYRSKSRSREVYTGVTYDIDDEYTRTDTWIWSDDKWRALSTQLTPIRFPGGRTVSDTTTLRATVAASLAWSSSSLLPGARVATLFGMPYSGGYTIRASRPDGHMERPHRHDSDEHITVTSGILHVGIGDSPDRVGARSYRAGDYLVIPAGTAHYSWTEGAVLVDVHWNGAAAPSYVDGTRGR